VRRSRFPARAQARWRTARPAAMARQPGPWPTAWPGPHRTGRARWPPTGPPLASPPRVTARHAGCRRCPTRPRQGPGRSPAPRRIPAQNPGLPAVPAFPRESLDRRGRPPPRRTSGRRGPLSRVPLRPGPAGLARSALGPRIPRAVRELPGPPAPRESGRPRRGPRHRDPVLPGRPLPGHPFRARRVPAALAPGRGRATTRSAQPRPAWGRHLRPGPPAPFPASRVVPARRPAALSVPGALAVPVRAAAGPLVPAARVVPVRAGSLARVPVVPGRAP